MMMNDLTSRMRHHGLRLARDCRGSLVLTLSFMILPLIGLVGLAADSMLVYGAQGTLRSALDAAGLAAAQSSTTENRQEVARRYFFTNSEALDGLLGGKADLHVVDEGGSISLSANAYVPTMFMGMFGIGGIRVQAETVIERTFSGRVEVAMVLDTSPSMQGTRIRDLRTASTSLLNTLYGSSNRNRDVRVSIVPYTGLISVGRDRRDWATGSWADWFFWRGCIDGRTNGPRGDDPPSHGKFRIAFALSGCPRTIQPATDFSNVLRDYIRRLNTSLIGGTRGDFGMLWGWRTLSPRWRSEWNRPGIADYHATGNRKIVVFMTDGVNSANGADNVQRQTCQRMKELGITIYTVGFSLSNPNARQLLADCASSPSHFFESANGQQLNAAFSGVANQLMTLRIAR